MAETYTQVPPDSTGDKLHMRERVRGSDTVLQQAVFLDEAPTYSAVADAVAFAANKSHIALFNATGSGVIVKIHDLRYIDLSIAAVTGVGVRFEVRKASASSAGTAITPEKWDSGDAALPAGVTVRTGGTVTDGNLLFPLGLHNDEILLAGAQPTLDGQSILPKNQRTKPFTLRENEGLHVKQITSTTVGSFAWLVIFTVEPTHTA